MIKKRLNKTNTLYNILYNKRKVQHIKNIHKQPKFKKF